MSEQQTPAVSSPAIIEVERGALVTWSPEERSTFRNTGKMPDTPQVEETAPSGTQETATSEAEPAKPAGESEPPKPQDHTRRKPTAEQRIGELVGETKRLKAELESLRKPATPSEPRPVVRPQQQANEAPNPEDKNPDGTPKYNTYEDFVRAQARWEVRQELAEQQRQQSMQTQARELSTKVQEARARYDNFDDVKQAAFTAIVEDESVSPAVKAMLNDSEILPDLIFTLGSDPKELASFVEMARTNTGKALRYIALTESLIRDQLDTAGKSHEAPAKPETRAPRPPSEVGGRAATPPDEIDSAVQANDFRRFKAEANRRDLARLKGK